MLRDQYAIDQFFLEIAASTSEMDPILAQIDELLADEELFQQLRHDLSQRYLQTTQT